MLVGPDGGLPGRFEKERAHSKAISHFLSRLREDPFLFMLYQVMWLRAVHWARLSNELSGSYHPHLVSSSCHEAADVLFHKAGRKPLPVALPKRPIIIAESTIGFSDRFSVKHISGGEPVFLLRGEKPVTMSSLKDCVGGYVEAVNNILRRVEEQF